MYTPLLNQISEKRVSITPQEIRLSIQEHMAWFREINLALMKRKPLFDNAFASKKGHQHCNFGCWLDNLELSDPMLAVCVAKIDKLHRKLHGQAKELVDDLIQRRTVKIKKFKKFQKVQQAFLDLLLKMLEYSVSNP